MIEIRDDTINNSPPEVFANGGSHAHTAQPSFSPSTKRSYAGTHQVDDGNIAPKRSRSQDIEMRCLVPAKCAGGIIGKGGSNIKDMRATFRAQIQLPDAQAPVRIFRANASLETLGEIALRVVPIIHDRSNGRKGAKMSLKLLIHQSQVGGVIGPKGFRINELREQSGAGIKVYECCLPNSTDRICEISGTPAVISKCIVLVLELLQSIPVKGIVKKHDPSMLKHK